MLQTPHSHTHARTHATRLETNLQYAHLERLLTHATLDELTLADCRFDATSFLALCAGIERNTQLRRLAIAGSGGVEHNAPRQRQLLKALLAHARLASVALPSRAAGVA